MRTTLMAFKSSIVLLFLTAASFGFVACTKPISRSDSNPGTANGTKDGGGGNLYNGKPLDSYIIDPKTLPAYQKLVLPLKAKLTAENGSLAFIEDWALQKTWYFLPGPLSQLPSSQIGAAVPTTQQGALQDFKTVWLDSDLYSKMSDSDQAVLILHEMLMADKLLRLQSSYSQCFAVRLDWGGADCETAPQNDIGTPADLTVTDYEEIRQTVQAILNLPAQVTGDQIEDIMAKGEFSFDWYVFRKATDKKSLDSDELKTIIRIPTLSNNLP